MAEEKVKRRVVITGAGMVTPLGRNCDETFENAAKGASGIDYITSFDTTGLPCRIGGQVKAEWLTGCDDEAADRLGRYSSRGLRLMRVATREAAAQARLDEVRDRERIGVSLGSHGENISVGEMSDLLRFYDGSGHWDIPGLLKSGHYSPFQLLLRKPDAASSILSMQFDCRGSSLSIVSACAAGAQAIGEACRIIQDRKADVMIAGGCEAALNFMGIIGFVLIKALAEKFATPQTASRPFDRKRNGFVMSEGAGAVILEDLDHARSRGAVILGELLGYGSSADAYRITDTHPKAEGAFLAMTGALEDAALTPEDIDYINAHGTSTIQNDMVESLAIRRVFGERAKTIPVSSNKSMLGHTIGAAGAIECILTLMGMNRSVILPTINYEFRDPKCDLDYVPNEARHMSYRRALSNSFGFGGQNACLCIGAFEG
jgi:3-oxoacyl-[acyl-carrier-protein] synthase II